MIQVGLHNFSDMTSTFTSQTLNKNPTFNTTVVASYLWITNMDLQKARESHNIREMCFKTQCHGL